MPYIDIFVINVLFQVCMVTLMKVYSVPLHV
jgi:hypothetical protein